ncbi:hypothetical protein FNO01nite_02240 [Flavobacterium noncentrifugens]|uniref:Uncharacterized protein n=1 Tax=Flavobacterium noncentrifugens TaxID=1128970 RepID=A0A1G8RRU8_9FLAO|nr:hypothetical protein [Flavobacterium noncentrifugens]GEP49552.1 hypothetical protein FNO01nite_02240 [Flavobacterium noncentrifugens]SDJ19639.1 hypothetical protein SAMN04487935_0251 [Flavobacterium noncentrifugens]
MKNIFKPLFFAALLTLSITSCKNKDAATETETTEVSSETSMDTVPPVPTEEMPATTDTTTTTTGTPTGTATPPATGTTPAK